MFDAVKVFSVTLARDREALGERINDWLADNPVEVVDTIVRQSSDHAFHCITVVVLYRKV